MSFCKILTVQKAGFRDSCQNKYHQRYCYLHPKQNHKKSSISIVCDIDNSIAA